jgi:hypothetical protein
VAKTLREAQLETDFVSVRQKVMEAASAMRRRMQELAASNGYRELLAMEQACQELLTIKTGKLSRARQTHHPFWGWHS